LPPTIEAKYRKYERNEVEAADPEVNMADMVKGIRLGPGCSFI
jgi:hypothetical protein